MVGAVGQRVAAVEEVPRRFIDSRALELLEVDARIENAPALLSDLFALLALQTAGEFVEVEVGLGAAVLPMELHPFAQQPASALTGGAVGLGQEQQMGR